MLLYATAAVTLYCLLLSFDTVGMTLFGILPYGVITYDVHVNMTYVKEDCQFLCGHRKGQIPVRLMEEGYERSAPPRRKMHIYTCNYGSPVIWVCSPCTCVRQLSAQPVYVTMCSTLSAAVGTITVVMGVLFSSRRRLYHLLVTLHRHVPHSKITHLRGGASVEER